MSPLEAFLGAEIGAQADSLDPASCLGVERIDCACLSSQ
jgi:hypothetical protein